MASSHLQVPGTARERRPTSPKAAAPQPRFEAPSDRSERDADAFGTAAARDLLAFDGGEAGAAGSDGGRPLPAAARSALGSRLGHDFRNVRVHADSRAAQAAEALNARAFTIGERIFFGAGEYEPRSPRGMNLLGHELAHVAQQARAGGELRLQRKLKWTGTPANIARAIAILNGGLFGWTASIDAAGYVTLARNAALAGPPQPTQDALRAQLDTVISNATDVVQTISSGTATIVGSYATGDIDVADMEQFGTGPGASAAGALIHEVVEQFQKQVNAKAFPAAHADATGAEAAVVGATRGPDRVLSSSQNADGTINAVIENDYTYPDRHVVTVKTTVSHNNIIRVERR